MGKTYDIICRNCGSPYQAIRANAANCRLCQITRDLMFLDETKFAIDTCKICDQQFAPIARKHKRICGECDMTTSSLNIRGDCGLCDRTNVILTHPDVRICKLCLTSPAQRDQVLRACVRKVKRRQAENSPDPV